MAKKKASFISSSDEFKPEPEVPMPILLSRLDAIDKKLSRLELIEGHLVDLLTGRRQRA